MVKRFFTTRKSCYDPENHNQLLTNKVSEMRITRIIHLYFVIKHWNSPQQIVVTTRAISNGNKSASAAGGRASELIYCAAVDR